MTTTALQAPWYLDKQSHLPLDVTWPKRILTHRHIPEEFREAFPRAAEFPYTIYLPGDDHKFFSGKPRQLVALTDAELVVMHQEALRKRIVTTTIPLDAILRIDYGTILLQSWLNIRSATQKAAIPFPTVAEHLFKPMLNTIVTRDARETAGESSPPQFETVLGYLKETNLKLFNAARTYLNDGQPIVAAAYQPEVERSGKRIFGFPVYRTHVTGHLSVLTETALILIKESQAVTSSRTGRAYGGSMTYVPVRQIRHVAFEDVSDRLNCVMNVILTDNSSIRTGFATDMVSNFEQFEETCRRHCLGHIRIS